MSLPEIDSKNLTPIMKQYWELKAQAPDAFLLFRMGDFYELFGDDAVRAAQILDITLTSRDKNKPNALPMAGVPHHSIQSYIQKLLNAGFKVALCEQLDETDPVKKIVRREIVRVLTPGIQFDSEGAEVHYLAAWVAHKSSGSKKSEPLGTLACLDVSTGETLVSQPITVETLLRELSRLSVKHLLLQQGALAHLNLDGSGLSKSILIDTLPANYLATEQAEALLKRHFELSDLRAFLPSAEAILTLGILVTYALRSQHQETLAHLRLPEPLHRMSSLVLGPNTPEHLDLDDLFALINRTQCTLGARQLKRWLNAPLNSSAEILERQRAIQTLASLRTAPESRNIYDLERILARVHTRLASPRDTLALGISLQALPYLARSLTLTAESTPAALITQMQARLEKLSTLLNPLAHKITEFQIEPAPITAREGGIFKRGLNSDLDRLLGLTEEGQQWLMDMEARERTATGISSLKIRYNRVFGYYIEITQAHLKNAPAHYQRKQTMVGAERFFTDELKKFEEEILTASSKQKALENSLLAELLQEIQGLTQPIMEAARLIGELDALRSLAQLHGQSGWCMPTIDDSRQLRIELGRHPMVDQARPGQFVPNSLALSPTNRLTLLITGPNMGGKSTVMRQNALIVILGQMGAPVPARTAQWGVVSSVYTRIGAQDAIASGQSTFMVEMSELAHILHHANERSLILLDEIGRGTSTYDGMSVAWSTLEWISTHIHARTLFATHYHELTRLALELPQVANAHMAVEGATQSAQGGTSRLRFLYELKDGPTNDSFGIHVAQMAGLPKPVIQRAWKILHELESQRPSDASRQMSFFDLPTQPIVETEAPESTPHPLLLEIEKIDVNQLTPLQALTTLHQFQEQLRVSGL